MKFNQFITVFICAVLIVLLVLIAVTLNNTEEPKPPEVNEAGLCHPEQAVASTPEPEPEPEYKMMYNEDDVIAVAKMLWGEARGCTRDNQIKCVWIVLNRVDDARFPDTIHSVLSQPSQFHGYSERFPVTDDLYNVAFDVLTRWSLEKQGVEVSRELPKSYLWFTGSGRENIFREAF